MSHTKDVSSLSVTPTLVVDSSPKSPGLSTPTTITEGPSPIDWTKTQTCPPVHNSRTLVLCFDGTGDEFDQDNSNVVQLFNLLKKDDHNKQLVYYQTGIGTYTSPNIVTPFIGKISKVLDLAFAWNLKAHVMHGYEFLMQNYTAGDSICIFGFSRGAHTARALAGMVHKVGLLPAWNLQQVPFAYQMYACSRKWPQSNAFKTTFSVDVKIKFVGVWDTVESVGFIPRELPFASSNVEICYFRHALAIDERRAKFKANHWKYLTPDEAKRGTDHEESAKAGKIIEAKAELASTTRAATQANRPENKTRWSWSLDPTKMLQERFFVDEEHESLHKQESEFEASYKDKPTDLLEVWFSGCHCDVGGGSVENNVPNSLARISLRWIIRECFETNTGIMFDVKKLRDIGLEAGCLYPVVQKRPAPHSSKECTVQRRKHFWPPSLPSKPRLLSSRKSKNDVPHKKERAFLSEEHEELLDAMSPRYDVLSKVKWWWILELLPMKHRHQTPGQRPVVTYKCNFGRPRKVPIPVEGRVNMHRSVLMRMEAQGERGRPKYKPRPRLPVPPADINWVD